MNSLKFKVAVVTPYFQIEHEKLKRCVDSVAKQSVKCDHILVADGEPQPIPDGYDLTHIVIPTNIGNCGATPRSFGAQYAFSKGYDAVAFLDADNWYDSDHIELASQAIIKYQADVVFARRHIVFPDGEILRVDDPEDLSGVHVDTNCYVFSKRAAFLPLIWSMYPKEFGIGEDRLMLSFIKTHPLKCINLPKKTIWYESNWGRHYRMAKKTPVLPIRSPARSLNETFDSQLIYERTGIRFYKTSNKNNG